MKISVAILTLYYKNPNYGGVLQAFALQKVLTELGCESKQISYDLETGYTKRNLLYRIIRKSYRICQSFVERKWKAKRKQYEENIYGFAENIPHTAVVSAQNISMLSPEFDMFICGSDQIWNPIGWQSTLFLDFVSSDKYKISYAASIARDDLKKSEIDYIEKHTMGFNAISVREEKTAEILNQYFSHISIEVMPDPTMLITKEEWSKLAAPRVESKPYIFAYFLGNDVTQREQAIKYATDHSMHIIFIPYMRKDMFSWDCEHERYMNENVGVPEFLSLIKYATMVITDSYHGAVFAAIFGKPLWILTRFKRYDANSMNSRLDTLVHELGIENRLIHELSKEQSMEINQVEVDSITNCLDSLRDKGFTYLKYHVKESCKCSKN